MTPKELKKLNNDLNEERGTKAALAQYLGVDPSKITKALNGHVKNKRFMSRLEAKAMSLLRKNEAEAVKS